MTAPKRSKVGERNGATKLSLLPYCLVYKEYNKILSRYREIEKNEYGNSAQRSILIKDKKLVLL